MTILGKIIVTLGIGIFTGSTLAWIITGEWQWFAGGGAVFFGTLLTAAVISAETKPTNKRPEGIRPTFIPATNTNTSTDSEDWQPPSTPPPDEVDPFDRPAQR
jgi:hypothetical protein